MSRLDARSSGETNDEVIFDILEVVQPTATENFGANENIQNGANDVIQNGANENIQNGANEELQNGANENIKNGADMSLEKVTIDTMQNGANVSIKKGANGTIQNGANDNIDTVDSDEVSKQKETTTACNKANCGDSCKFLGREGSFFIQELVCQYNRTGFQSN